MTLVAWICGRRFNCETRNRIGFDAATASSLAKPVRVTLQPITLSRAKGQSPKNKDKHGFYCYPIRKANAGSVLFCTIITQNPNPYRWGFFLPVPPVKTALASRASRRRRRVFRPDSRRFLSLLTVGTRALATPYRAFTRVCGQRVREVIWSGGGESEKGLARYARIHFGRRRWLRTSDWLWRPS